MGRKQGSFRSASIRIAYSNCMRFFCLISQPMILYTYPLILIYMKKDRRKVHVKRKRGRMYKTRQLDRAEFMGIDWGRSDVGVALAEKEARIAYAHTTLDNDKTLLERLGRIIAAKGVRQVVLGIPSPVNRQDVEYDSERLGEILENNFGVTVSYQNEMFSTKLAERQLIERGVKGIERYDDQESARIILQDWLDRQTLGSGGS